MTGNLSLFGIQNGIFIHQVNCQNAIGGGLSGAIIQQFPAVKQNYHECFKRFSKDVLYGKKTIVWVTKTLAVCNLFSQFYYGNPKRTGKQYTNIDYLIDGIADVANKFPNENIYIPYNIGCGLGGADWNIVFHRIKELNLPNLYLTDTKNQSIIPFTEATKDTFSGIEQTEPEL